MYNHLNNMAQSDLDKLKGTEKFMVLMFSEIVQAIQMLRSEMQELSNMVRGNSETVKENFKEHSTSIEIDMKQLRGNLEDFINQEFSYLKRKQPIKKKKK